METWLISGFGLHPTVGSWWARLERVWPRDRPDECEIGYGVVSPARGREVARRVTVLLAG
jgi:hypothetical protein